MFTIAKNRGINRTRHESVTMLQRYLNIFLLRVKIWSVYIETSITLSSGLKYMKSSMDSHKWAFQIKNIVQSRCAVLSFSDTGVDDLLTLDCFYCTVLTWLLQCKLLLLAFEVLLRFSHRKTGFCVFFLMTTMWFIRTLLYFDLFLLYPPRRPQTYFARRAHARGQPFVVCFGDNSAEKFLKTLTLYIFSALLNLNPIERNSFAVQWLR